MLCLYDGLFTNQLCTMTHANRKYNVLALYIANAINPRDICISFNYTWWCKSASHYISYNSINIDRLSKIVL